MKHANLNLEKKVSERTKELEEAYAELNNFTYRSAHDLKGPIARLLGLCHLAKIEINDDKAIQYLSRFENTASQMGALLSELMMAQEIKTKLVEFHKIKLKGLLANIIDEVHADIKNDVKFSIDMEEDLLIDSDPLLMKALLKILIDNAISYRSKNGDCHIQIAGCLKSSQLEITIQDNGIGILEEMQDKIFDMFSIGSENSTGLGLGLYKAKIITKKLHGSISLENQLPGETCFKVIIPLG